MRRIKLVRRQHLSEKATPVAENVCVWFISNGVGSEGVGLYPFPLPGICESFAKQMSLLWDRARTRHTRGRYKQHLLTLI